MGVNPKPPSKSPDSRHGSAHRSRFSAVNGTTGKFQKSVPQLPRRSEPPGRSKFFSGFFQTKLKPAGLSRDATAHEKFLKDQIAIRKNVAIERVADDLSNLLLSDYGPPQYGISQASWTLLLMARRCAEEVRAIGDRWAHRNVIWLYKSNRISHVYCMLHLILRLSPFQLVVMLGLYGRHGETGGKTAVLFRLQEPTPTQIQGINRQEEEALRMGSSRSIRSDFPSARGRDRRDFRSWETNSDDASSEITPGYPFSPSGMKPESARMGRIIRAQNALDSDPDIDTHVGPDPDPDSSRGLPPRQSTISPIRNTSASSLENPRINSSRSTTRI